MALDRDRAHRHDLDHAHADAAAPDAARAPAAPDLSAAAAAVESLQAKASGRVVMTDDQSKRESAAAGVAGPAQALPHLDAIQQSFGGAHDLSGVEAHVGGAAADASHAIGAEGFAAGNQVAFARQPDLHLAAHEAAHVVQQRDGVSLKGGVGESGDSHEQHADQVADRVVKGESAADLLPGGAAKAATHDAGGAFGGMQLYEEKVIGGDTWRVSESGNSALLQDGTNQSLYATTSMITDANTTLEQAGQNGSFIVLTKGDGMEIAGKTLHHVVPTMKPKGADPDNKILEKANKPGGKDAEGETGDTMALWSDCGRSSRTIMGTDGYGLAPHGTYKSGDKTKDTARGYDPSAYSDTIYKATMPAFIKDPKHHKFLKEGVHYTGDLEYIWDAIAGNADKCREQYWELGEEGRRVFDQFAGINTAADPEVGGAYTMNTEYNMPGSDVVRETDGTARMRWNFHWGGVIMKDGANNVTLENYAVMFEETGDAAKDAANAEKAYDWTNRNWNFQMYGTVKTGQTFHEQHLDTGTHGTRASTFAAKVD